MQSLRYKTIDLEVFLEINNCDVVLITEHWLKSNEIPMLNIKNYRLVNFSSRSTRKGGGTLIMVKDDFVVNSIDTKPELCNEDNIEFSVGELIFQQIKIILICAYRSPCSQTHIFLNWLDKTIFHFSSKYKNHFILIGGDFNIDNNSSTTSEKLNQILLDYNIPVLNYEPTRITNLSRTSIDYLNTNFPKFFCKTHTISTYFSDHQALFLEIDIPIKPTTIGYTVIKKLDLNKFEQSISEVNFNSLIKSSCSVNDNFNAFHKKIQYVYSNSVKYINKKDKKNTKHKQWITKGIRISSANIKCLYRLTITKNEVICRYYKLYKKIYRKVIITAKKLYYANFIKEQPNKSKAAWDIINNNWALHKKTKNNFSKIDIKGESIYNDTEISNAFNIFFSNIPSMCNNQYLYSNTLPSFHKSIYLFPCDKVEISNIICNLKSSNACGIDNLSNLIIKKINNFISKPLASLINQSFEEGIFPNNLKITVVQPILKKGDASNINNYRPISLTSIFSKIYEKVYYNRIYSFLTLNNILSPKQFGFMKGKSTKDALCKLTNYVHQYIDMKKSTVAAFLDLSKAFDMISHTLLLDKLYKIGIRGNALHWIKTYLRDRIQHVRINERLSDPCVIKKGVPQGSILGPLLFIVFVNDIFLLNLQSDIIMYADDVSIIFNCENEKILQKQIESDLCLINNWFNNNCLSINVNKSNFIYFNSFRERNYSLAIRLNNSLVRQSSNSKILGIIIDECLNWKVQIDDLYNKIQPLLYQIFKIRYIVYIDTLMMLYYGYFYSRVSYSIIFWGGHSNHLYKIFRLQKKIIRAIFGLDYFSPCKHFFIKHNILTIPSLLIYESILFVFKNYDILCLNKSYHTYNTRHGNDLTFPLHRLTNFEKSPLYSAIKLYNYLPTVYKTAIREKRFPKLIKKFLVENAFYSINEYLHNNCDRDM